MGPFLGVNLVPQTEVRNIMIPIFHDMMDWEQRKNGNFKQVSVTVSRSELQIARVAADKDERWTAFLSNNTHVFWLECVSVCVGGSRADGQAGQHGVGWERRW